MMLPASSHLDHIWRFSHLLTPIFLLLRWTSREGSRSNMLFAPISWLWVLKEHGPSANVSGFGGRDEGTWGIKNSSGKKVLSIITLLFLSPPWSASGGESLRCLGQSRSARNTRSPNRLHWFCTAYETRRIASGSIFVSHRWLTSTRCEANALPSCLCKWPRVPRVIG
jgi:hypothetical protein